MISVQLAACLPPIANARDEARLAIFSLAAVMEALLAARLAAFLVNLLESLTQVERALLAASSNFLHLPKTAVHFPWAAVMAADSLLALQVFSSSMSAVRLLWVQ